ncbi:phytoene/squalene synthase family protein [Prosthecobacter dejongeii]|uniref:Farnesyl-diphosphate farnesyltransferase n=1 Tax=Prosthecobacter dejongeii TaxID=48465 RepID=A0A7W7YLD2_9BACT|nr:squalene/phytoene synthase family protein [Prosthecobacter dejongeii]MBB5038127.1 farnesyl-diphosphate farnesyltransferase [Prosthecobacter dejongeii]
MTDESLHERELGGQLLASVSRSFYLTLKALPRELREPISLAYLLARTADTIADTAAVPAEVRLNCLRDYERLVQGQGNAVNPLAETIQTRFVSLQEDEAERRLMERFADGVAWLGTIGEVPLKAIREVLHHIIQGQILDIQRFPDDGEVRALNNEAELDEYTWLVAGCVGEFWTEMCAAEKPDSLDSRVSIEQMKSWGADFGKGLQLINILRDVGEDGRDGRCYLPGGLQGEAQLKAAWSHWLVICRQRLQCGLLYVQHVSDGKLRYATALPLLLGAKTVRRMEAASWEQVQQGIKISRLDVAMILAEAAVACRKPENLEKLFVKLAG